jgi:hypothetical protein
LISEAGEFYSPKGGQVFGLAQYRSRLLDISQGLEFFQEFFIGRGIPL